MSTTNDLAFPSLSQPLRVSILVGAASLFVAGVFGSSSASAQFSVVPVGGLPPPGVKIRVQSSLYDDAYLPPDNVPGDDFELDFTTSPPTPSSWSIYETDENDCIVFRDPSLPPTDTDPQPLGATLTPIQGSPATRLEWKADMSAVGVGTHCLAVEACDTGGTCRVSYVYIDALPNPPPPYFPPASPPPPRAFSMHAVTAVEGTEQPVGVRLYAENMSIKPPVTTSDICVRRCPNNPTGTITGPGGICDTGCGVPPNWVGFQGDTLTWTFQPPYGARGPWEFLYTHPDLDAGAAPAIVVDVIPASKAKPRVKEALWAADFGGPYRIPLETFTKEQEARNDALNTAPYFDRGYLSGEIEPAGEIDAFTFHVGTNEWHRFTTRRSGTGPGCVFPATLQIFDITNRLPTDTLASVMESQVPISVQSGAGPNGCALIDTLELENQHVYLLTVQHRDGGTGYDYVIHHEVFVEEVEDDINTSTYTPLVRAEALFEPGVIGTFSSAEDVDWGWIHLQTANRAQLVLSRTDGSCTGLSSATISVTAFDGTSDYTDASDTGASFFTNLDGCPEGTIDAPAFGGGDIFEARYNIAVTGATGTYRLGIRRFVNADDNPPPAFEADLLDINDPANAIRPGTCGALQAFLLDDYAEGASFFGAFISPLDGTTLGCNGFGEVEVGNGDKVAFAPDPYGVCRPLFALPLNDPEENDWDVAKTQFGTLVYTENGDAPPVQVIAMATDLPPGVGNAAGQAGGEPTILTVSDSGEVGNDFYYDPYGECDVQTYPSPICKGDASVFTPPEGAPNLCRINAPKRYVEGQRIEFEMTRWNRTATDVSGNPVEVETLVCDSGSCTLTDPSVLPAYDFSTDRLSWDIPYDLLDSGATQEVHLRLTYSPEEFGGEGPTARYVFQFFVADLDEPSEQEVDVLVSAVRLAEPLAKVDLDTRVIHRAFQSTNRSAARHASNTGYFQFATNTRTSRTVGVNDRIQVHPQFENGRLTQGSGPPQFEVMLRNRGETSNPAGELDVFLMPATVDGFGNFESVGPDESDSPVRSVPIPAMPAGEQQSVNFRIATSRLLGVSGSEPWIAASSALYFRAKVDSDGDLENNLFGPVYVTPARPPQACVGCNGDPSGGFAGAYSSSKDITGVIASMTPESPKSGDLVTVNVQVQFSGTGFTDDGQIRFYVDQETAPTSTTTPHQSANFPTSPTAGTIYGYAFTFTAEKPISSINALPVRVYLDATNRYSEPGTGEANNQLPTNSAAELVAVENSPPTFPSVPPTEATEDILWSYEVQVADSDDVDFDRLSISLAGPSGMDFEDALVTCTGIPTRKCVVLQWVPEHGDGGDHAVTLEACDGDPVEGGDGGCSTQDFTVTVTEVNDDPVFSADTPPEDATEDTPYAYTFIASDEESTTLTWTLVEAPAGMTLTPAGDSLSATLSWTPSDSGVGDKDVQVRVSDGDGGSETVSWTLTTANVNDAPTLSTAESGDLSASEGTLYSATFTISDVDNSEASQGQVFDCSASTVPAFLSVSTVGASCVLSGTPSNADTGPHLITVAVSDSGSPSLGDTSGFTLTVADTVNATPSLAAVATQSATQDVPFSLDIGVSDDDFNSPGYAEDITFSIDAAVTDPTTLALTDNGTSVNIAWTPTNDEVGANTIKIVATDERGASTSRTFTVNVANVNDAPILSAPSNATISEGATYSTTLVASDPDGDTITYSLVSGAPPGFTVSTDGLMSSGVTDDAQVGAWNIRVRAEDDSGEGDEQTFTLTVNNVQESPSFPVLANDDATEDSLYTRTVIATDPDPGDSVTFTFDGSVPTGLTIDASTGEIEWNTPEDADVGVHEITVLASDANGNSVSRTFDLTVANTNDAPTITSTAPTSATEEVAYSYTLIASDDDVDSGDTLTYSAPTLPSWLSFNTSTRVLSGTPDDADVGTHPVSLRVTDSEGESVDEDFSIVVTGVNDAPVLTTIGGEVVDGSPLAFSVDENQTLALGVFATDIDSATLTYSVDLNGNSFDAFSVNASTGAISFTPSFDEAGSYLVFIEVTDDGFLSDTEPVTLNVTNVNRAPIFAWTPDTTAQEDALHTDIASATDPDGDTVTYALQTSPSGMTINASTGAIAFTPDNDDVGSHPVTVRASDTGGLFTDESFSLVVSNINDAPVITSSAPTTVEEESTYTYTVEATDADGDSLTYSAQTLPGWLTFSTSTRVLSGVPDDAEVGSHPVLLRVVDGNGGVANDSFTIVVSQKNDAPVFVAPTPTGTVTGSEGSPLTFTVAATDAEGDTLTYTATGLPAGATLNASTGAFAWTPDFNAAGSISITLRVSDGSLTTTQPLTLSVSNTDRAPTISAPASASGDEGQAIAFGVTASDPDGDSTTLSLLSAPTSATFDGATFSWVPSFDDSGTVDVTFRATAGGQTTDAVVEVTVNQVNQSPSLGAPSTTDATQDAPFSSDLAAADIDLDEGDVLTFTLVSGPAGMTLTKIGDDIGRLAWTPTASQIGTFGVEVSVEDAAGLSASRSFDVTVANVNDAPVITSSAPTNATQGASYSYVLTATDLDSGLGDVVTLSAPTLPAWLSFTPSTGALSGTPTNADVANHNVILRAQDLAGAFDSESFTINVANVNDAPQIAPVANQNVAEGETIAFTVTATDIDGAAPTLVVSGAPTGATFTTSSSGGTTTGTFTWVTTATDEGTYPLTFTASDGALNDSESVTLTVGNVNRPPALAAIGDQLVNEGETLSFTVTATDPDAGDTVTLSAVSGAPNIFSAGATFSSSTGTFAWTPDFDASGTYSVTFTASDGSLSDSETISIVVTNQNRAPAFVAPTPETSVAGAEGDALTFNVAATDADGDSLTLSASGLPSGATFDTATGDFAWTPSFNQAGTVNILLQVNDGTTTTNRPLDLVIANTDRSPVLSVPPTATISEGQLLSYAVVASDPDGDTVTLSIVSAPAGATITAGTLEWTPTFDEPSSQTITIRATAGGQSTDASTTVTVNNTNRAPTLGAPSNTAATQDTLFSASLSAADDDLATTASDTLVFSLVSGPPSASTTQTGATTVRVDWTPGALDVNPPSQNFIVRVTDADGATADRSFSVSVTNVNDAPIFAVLGDRTLEEGASLSITLNATDLDIEAGLSDTLTFSLLSGPTGMVVASSTGALTWSTTDDQVGTHPVSVRVVDAAGAEDTSSFNVTVTDVADAPVFTSTPSLAVDQDQSYNYIATTSDADAGAGGEVTVSASLLPTWLTFSSATGTLAGTPRNADVGNHPVTLVATDGTGLSTTQNFTIVVANVNDAPVFTPVANQSGAEGAAIQFSVTATDPDQDPLTISYASADLPPAATFDGVTFRWPTTFDDAGTYTATFTADDGELSATIDVTITVGGSNRAPILDPIADLTIIEGETGAFSASATDPDGDPLTFSAVAVGAPDAFDSGANFDVDTAAFSWTPDFESAGTYEILVTVSDQNATDSQTVFVTIENQNRSPAISSTPVTEALEDEPYTYAVEAGDPDGDGLFFSLTTRPAGMTVDAATGEIVWTPSNAHVGTHPVAVRVDDGVGGSTTQEFSLVVDNVNDTPTFTSTPVVGAVEDSLYTYAIEAEDIDIGSVVTLSAATLPPWLTFAPETGILAGTPDDPDIGTHAVSIVATDEEGAAATQAFEIVVTPNNDAPVFVDPTPSGTLTIAEGETLAFTAVATDPDGPSLAYEGSGLPTGAALDSATGVFAWTPTFSDAGTYTFTLIANDSLAIGTRTLTVVVSATDRPPTLSTPATVAATEGELLTFVVETEDPDGDAVEVSAVGQPAEANFDASTGTFTWTPGFDDSGTFEVTFTAEAQGQSASAITTITVANANRPPTLLTTPPSNASEDTPLSAVFVASDPDGDSVSIQLIAGPANAAFDAASNTLTWTPLGSQVGQRTFTLRLNDGNNGIVDINFSIAVSPRNDAPVFTSAPLLLATEDVDYSYDADAFDEDSDILTYTLVDGPAEMTVDAQTGELQWRPTNEDVGQHDVTIRVQDPSGESDEQAFVVDVENVNDPPTFGPGPGPTDAPFRVTVAENSLFQWNTGVSDVDSGDTVTLSLLGAPAAMTLTDGIVEWTPTASDVGEVTFRVRAQDTAGAITDVTVTVVVENLNDPPFFLSDPINDSTPEDALWTASILADDIDGDAVQFSLLNAPLGMTIEEDAGYSQLTFVPQEADVGVHNFIIRATDENGSTADQEATLEVTPVNDAPVLAPIANQSAQPNVEFSLTLALAFPDTDGPSTTFALVDGPSGVAVLGAQLTWTPEASQVGAHLVTVSVTDSLASDTESFTVVVGDGELPPTVILPPDSEANEGTLVSEPFIVTTSDGSPATVSVFGLPAGANYDEAIGQFTWVPTFDQAGDYPIRVDATDANGTTSKTWNLRIRDVNRPPTLVQQTGAFEATESLLFNDNLGASDLDGDPLTYTLTEAPAGLTIGDDGTFDWTPTFGQLGNHLLTVIVSDGRGGQTSGQFSIRVDFLDEDDDQMPDTYEVAVGLDPTVDDSGQNPDGDGLVNLDEFLEGTDPFVSDAPAAATLLSPADHARVLTATPTLTFAPGTDPNGFALQHRVVVRAVSTGVTVAQFDVAEISSSISVDVEDVLDEGATYEWFVTATSFGGNRNSDVRRFIVDAVNEAPPPPLLISPVDDATVSTRTPTLRAFAQVDPEAESMQVIFSLRQTQDGPPSIVTEPQSIGPQGGEVTVDVPELLNDGSTWLWNAHAVDSRGLAGPSSGTRRFTVDLGNAAPPTPILLSPEEGEVLTSPPLTLRASASEDPEGLEVTTLLELARVSSFIDAIEVSTTNVTDGEVQFVFDESQLPSSPDGTWYWRVIATDGATFSAPATGSFVIDWTDEAPSSPTLRFPEDNSLVYGTEVTLRAAAGVDPEGGAVLHHFELLDADGTTELQRIDDVVDGDDGAVDLEVAATFDGLEGGRLYAWRVSADDGQNAPVVSPTFRFRVDASNERPGAPILLAPQEDAVVDVRRPVFEFEQAIDPDGDDITHDFEIWSGETLTYRAENRRAEDGIVTVVPPMSLGNGAYLWRARGRDIGGGGAWEERTLTVDAEDPVDAGPDGGPVDEDGGVTDGGSAPDGGPDNDAGTPSPEDEGPIVVQFPSDGEDPTPSGCACSTSSAPDAFALAALLGGLLLGQRRRQQRRRRK